MWTMWTCDRTEYVITTLQPFNVSLTTDKNQYWRDTSLTNEEE